MTFLLSYRFFLSLFFVLSGAFFFYALVLRLPFWQVFQAPQSLLFIGLMFLNRLGGLVKEVKERRWYRSLLSLWLIVIILGFLINCMYRYDLILHANNEAVISSSIIDRGLISKPEVFSVRFEDSFIKVSSEGETYYLKREKDSHRGLNQIFYIKKELSPRFVLRDLRGRELDSAFVLLDPDREDYFRSPALPHRFYVKKEKEGFGLRIMRGKLTLKKGILKIGEEMEFEGLKISFPEVKESFQIRIINYPGNGFMFLGSVSLILIAIVLKILRSGKDGDS